METIYICHHHIFKPGLEYKIDLKNKSFWEYDGIKNKPRDKSSKNEGFHFTKNLTQDEINVFLAEIKKYKIDSWQKEYINHDIDGGHFWEMNFVFSDGTQKKVRGINLYPANWKEIGLAMNNLTGTDMLHVINE